MWSFYVKRPTMKQSPQKPAIYIPEPCHEDWVQMTEAQRGRHCAVCDKVVTDFTRMEMPEIHATLSGSTDTCGRFRPEQVDRPPLRGSLRYRYPLHRMRIFLAAFIASFGFQVWGFSSAEAQNMELNVKVLQTEEGMNRVIEAEKNADASEIRLRGRVLDTFTDEPVELASLRVYENGRFITKTYSDEEGRFCLVIPKDRFQGDSYDLQISYLGLTRTEEAIPHDTPEMIAYIDVGYTMDVVQIHARRPSVLGTGMTGTVTLAGNTIMGISDRTGPLISVSGAIHDGRAFYRPMDEWLMMHSSEIHHSGRW